MKTAWILAGGQSSRVGRDKALLPVGSHTLIEVVIERIRPLVEQVAVIGGAHNVPRLRELLPAQTILMDVRPGYGPLMGLYTGLMHTETLWNLFLPCDMPWVEGRVIERLAGACQGDADVIAGRHPTEGVQPFPLLCHVKACGAVGALLDRGERALQALLRHPGARLITIQEPELWRSFTNVNTLADYVKFVDEATLAH